jgi:hypothetical protein
MDRIHYNPYSGIDHYYSQTHQENGQHTSQPHRNSNTPEQKPSSSRPDMAEYFLSSQQVGVEDIIQSNAPSGWSQPHRNPNRPAQKPSSSGSDMAEYFLSSQQAGVKDIIQQNAPSGRHLAPGQSRPHRNPNTPAQKPSSSGPDMAEYFLRSQQAGVKDIIQNDGPLTNPSWLRP